MSRKTRITRMAPLSISQKALYQQGYASCSREDLNNMSNGLRFTPLVCMALAIGGLYIQSPIWHFSLAALGILPFWTPNHHPFDILYNNIFRHLVGGVPLPSNPLPRRIACVMGGIMNIGIGFGFLIGNTTLAYVFAAILIPLQIIVISTHFCLASWMYEQLMQTVGLWEKPISIKETKQLLTNGAILVDVRSPQEFKTSHLPGAINIPLEIIENEVALNNQEVILYCKSGIRCNDAKNKLEQKGSVAKAYSFGSMNRWE